MGKDYYLRTFGTAGNEGVDVLMKMLVLDPRKRITAKESLKHAWWRADPKPTRKEELPRKRGGEAKVGEDLKRRPGVLDDERGGKVARKLDFTTVR
jgi:cyclin-dependent kinase 7